jgi:hypothetical protein
MFPLGEVYEGVAAKNFHDRHALDSRDLSSRE